MNKKAINFDLDTKKLKHFYPKQNISQAYNDIRQYLDNMGFEHRQESSYVSKNKISYTTVEGIVKKMTDELNWLSKCVKEIDVTDVGSRHYSLLQAIRSQDEISKEIVDNKEIEIDIDIAEDFEIER